MRVRQFDMDGAVPQEPAFERRHLQASMSGLTISEGESGTTAKAGSYRTFRQSGLNDLNVLLKAVPLVQSGCPATCVREDTLSERVWTKTRTAVSDRRVSAQSSRLMAPWIWIGRLLVKLLIKSSSSNCDTGCPLWIRADGNKLTVRKGQPVSLARYHFEMYNVNM